MCWSTYRDDGRVHIGFSLKSDIFNELHHWSDLDGLRDCYDDFIEFCIDERSQCDCLVTCIKYKGRKVPADLLGKLILSHECSDSLSVNNCARFDRCANQSVSKHSECSIYLKGEAESDSDCCAFCGNSCTDLTILWLKCLTGWIFLSVSARRSRTEASVVDPQVNSS